MLDLLLPWVSLLGLVGFAGLWGLKRPVEKSRPGGGIRLLGLLGLSGLLGFWIPGVGAIGASGALGLWNHQDPKLARWGQWGWAWLAGLPYLARYLLGQG